MNGWKKSKKLPTFRFVRNIERSTFHSKGSMKRNPPILAITMGDPGGIGPEIIVKALKKVKPASCAFLVIGAREAFQRLRQKTGLFLSAQEISSVSEETIKTGQIYFLEVTGNLSRKKGFQIGKVVRENGLLAFAAIKQAALLAQQKKIGAIVTAPIHKETVRLVDKKFIGHTEFFAHQARVKNYAMMFISPKLNVTLATIHVPLKKVSALLTVDGVLEKILLTHHALKHGFYIKKPKIAICALNPHGRECGSEEDAVIRPAVLKAWKRGIQVEGPYSADTLFHAAYHGRYDALISMYHDQALGPFKMVAFHKGVNTTLGLPYVRTSPDHGTAFDKAYQGKADPSSMIEALRLAQNLVLSRHAHTD